MYATMGSVTKCPCPPDALAKEILKVIKSLLVTKQMPKCDLLDVTFVQHNKDILDFLRFQLLN